MSKYSCYIIFMDQIARAAYINSQVACMQAKLAAMQAQNMEDSAAGKTKSHAPSDFENLSTEYGLDHNTVVVYLLDN